MMQPPVQEPAVPYTIVTYVDEQGIYQEIREAAGQLVACFDRVAHDVVQTLSQQASEDQAMTPFFLVNKKLSTGQIDLNVFWSPEGLVYVCLAEKFRARFFGLFSRNEDSGLMPCSKEELQTLLQKIDAVTDDTMDAWVQEVGALSLAG